MRPWGLHARMRRYETTKANDAVKALKASLKPQATACRDGRWQVLDATLLVPGDLVLLGSGAHIPADCRVRAALGLACAPALGALPRRQGPQCNAIRGNLCEALYADNL